eukprot:Lankesteria_metandrocarpae@DN4444_c0_g1_i1.p1
MQRKLVLSILLIWGCLSVIASSQGICGDWNAEVMIVQDVSFSFADDLKTLSTNSNPLLTLFDMFPKARIGLSSFSDKPGSYHTDYCFNLDHRLSEDKESLTEAYKSLSVKNGGDVADSQLDALLHSLRDPVGWTVGATDESGMNMLRVLVLITDDTYHTAEESSLPPYNSYHPKACEFHAYPYETEVRTAMTTIGAVPLFLVTSDIKEQYETLLRKTNPSGVVTAISSDSSDILDALKYGLETITCGVATTTTTTISMDAGFPTIPLSSSDTTPEVVTPQSTVLVSDDTGSAATSVTQTYAAVDVTSSEPTEDGNSTTTTESTLPDPPPALPVTTKVGIAFGGFGALLAASGALYFSYGRLSGEAVPPEMELDVELSGESGIDFDDFSRRYS